VSYNSCVLIDIHYLYNKTIKYNVIKGKRSINSSVHFAKRMGSELDFFTRLEVLVIEENETRLLSYFDAVAQKAPFINPQITQLSELRSMQC